jgi:xylulokinase
MYLGLDLGTSGVKAVLCDQAGAVVAQAEAPLGVSRPHPLWSEQDPADWWAATQEAVARLPGRDAVRAIGLSGQMHGAVLLDDADRVLRPAILWNDGRSAAECAPLDALARRVAGNRAMPGFTAPKLLWVRAHERATFDATARVLLPKDFLRLRLTGEHVSEVSDASGTLWLDVAARAWSEALLAATHLTPAHMPRLVEGSEISGRLRAEAAIALGLPKDIPVAGGGGDNAAGAVGIGCIAPGDAFVSLGTSGVVFVADAAPLPDPENTVHAFCHALPARWHRMAVILSAAASLAWFASVSGADVPTLLADLDAAGAAGDGREIFLPYLSGERTPHDDPRATGVFFGLTAATTRADMTRAVLEGVAFALADGLAALEAKGPRIDHFALIGGGARSHAWARLIASTLGRPLVRHAGAEVGPALGAARLARIAAGDGSIAEVCVAPPIADEIAPAPALAEQLAPRHAIYRTLYPTLKATFAEHAA